MHACNLQSSFANTRALSLISAMRRRTVRSQPERSAAAGTAESTTPGVRAPHPRCHRCCGRGCYCCATITLVVLAAAVLPPLLMGPAVVLGAVRAKVHDIILETCADAHKPSFDVNATLPWATAFRAQWRTIREELHRWERGGGRAPQFRRVDPLQEDQDPSGGWSTLWLKVYGAETEAAGHFPRTMRALRHTPASSAMFSILQPGQGLRVHRGDLKAVLRYHLALEVPPPGAGESDLTQLLVLSVAQKLFYDEQEEITYDHFQWREGEDLLFDDTFIHFVTNERTTARRVVLFVDVPRTDCGVFVGGTFHLALHYGLRFIYPRIAHIIARANEQSKGPRAVANVRRGERS